MQVNVIFTIVYTNAIDSDILDLQTKAVKVNKILDLEIPTKNDYSGWLKLDENTKIILINVKNEKFILNKCVADSPIVMAWNCSNGHYYIVSKSEIVSAYLKVG